MDRCFSVISFIKRFFNAAVCFASRAVWAIVFSTFLISNTIAESLTDGPVVGAVTDTSAKVFVRVSGPGAVYLEYSTDPNLRFAMQSDVVYPRYRDDFTAIIPIDGLLPNRTYYYQVIVDGQPALSSLSSFISFPPDEVNTEFTFAALADVGTSKSRGAPSYARLAIDEPRFLLQIGDWDHRDPQTLDDMRLMHREVRGQGMSSGRYFRDFIANTTPLYYVWDDHDYGMNDGDYTFAGKADAIKAYREYFPTPELPNPEAGIWQSFRYAQVEIFMLDVRSNRDPNTDTDDENKSMLNGENIENGQKEWLFSGLANSTAKWKIITSGVTFNPTTKPADAWGAFTTEWQEVVDFITANNIRNVLVLSGDLHSGGAFDDGTNAGVPEMSVPHSNMNMNDDHPTGITTHTPGTWTSGYIRGPENPGYVLVTVETNPDKLILEVKGVSGDIRMTETLEFDD